MLALRKLGNICAHNLITLKTFSLKLHLKSKLNRAEFSGTGKKVKQSECMGLCGRKEMDVPAESWVNAVSGFISCILVLSY